MLPKPGLYKTWQEWALALIKNLSARKPTADIQLPIYTVTTLPSAAQSGQFIYVSDEAGGAIPAFSDGTDWRRVSDRAVVS